jgi:1-deoxy-D-xylulose-5-phosphate synthase
MYTAQLGINFPLAIRYPRGQGTLIEWKQPMNKIEIGKGICVSEGSEIAVLSIGAIGNKLIELQPELQKHKIAHYSMRFVKPLDEGLLHQVFKKFDKIVTVEDGTIIGGFGSAILEFASNNNYKNKTIRHLGIPDQFIEHGKVEELLESIHLSKEKIKEFLLKLL